MRLWPRAKGLQQRLSRSDLLQKDCSSVWGRSPQSQAAFETFSLTRNRRSALRDRLKRPNSQCPCFSGALPLGGVGGYIYTSYMCVYIYSIAYYIYIYSILILFIFIYIYISYIHIFISYVCIYIYIYIFMYISYLYIYLYHMYVCMYVCIYI